MGHRLHRSRRRGQAHDLRRTAVRNMVRRRRARECRDEDQRPPHESVFDWYNVTDERDLRDAMAKTQAYLSSQR